MKSYKEFKKEKILDRIYKSREASEHLRDKQRDHRFQGRKKNSTKHKKKSSYYGRKAREQERTTALMRRRLDNYK